MDEKTRTIIRKTNISATLFCWGLIVLFFIGAMLKPGLALIFPIMELMLTVLLIGFYISQYFFVEFLLSCESEED